MLFLNFLADHDTDTRTTQRDAKVGGLPIDPAQDATYRSSTTSSSSSSRAG
jgi:hypothetical protein